MTPIAVSNWVNIIANFNPENLRIGAPGISGLANWPGFRDPVINSLLVPSEPGFSIDWYPYESLMTTGRASSQNCSSALVKVLSLFVDTSELLNKGVNDVKFLCFSDYQRLPGNISLLSVNCVLFFIFPFIFADWDEIDLFLIYDESDMVWTWQNKTAGAVNM